MNNFLQVFENEVTSLWGDVEALAIDETKAVWKTFKTAFLKLDPKTMFEQVVPTLEAVFKDVVIHDYGDALQQITMYAEVNVVPWLKDVNEHELTAIIASWQSSKLAKVI